MPRPIALVSAAEARHLDSDLSLIVRALADRGVVSDIKNWDDAAVDWGQYAAAIVRSTWDYHRRYDEFLAWINDVSTQTVLHNPAQVITWSTDKVYLQELERAGIPIIPTTYVSSVEDVERISAEGLLERDIVVKPTVSAGSNNTERHIESPVKAATHLGALIEAGMTAMVQPYQRFIDERGETGLLYFNGQFSHAFRKGAILAERDAERNDLYVEEDIGPRTASEQERELGDRVMKFVVDKFGEAPLYARVDVVRGSAGVPILMELELAEPSLFLHTAADSATRFASAVMARR